MKNHRSLADHQQSVYYKTEACTFYDTHAVSDKMTTHTNRVCYKGLGFKTTISMHLSLLVTYIR